jgi:hypothetical protein
LFDFRFVTFSRTLLRLLARPAQGVQDPANMVGMIPHCKMLLDYVGNSRTRPLIGCVPGRERTFLENGYQVPLLLARQTWAPTRMRLGLQGIQTTGLQRILPTFHRGGRGAYDSRHFANSLTLKQ